MKGLFANRSVFFQISILFYLILMGAALYSVAGYLIMQYTGTPSFYIQHIALFISNIFLFILPATGTAWLCSTRPTHFLHLPKKSDTKTVLLAVIMLIALSPTIDITTYLNANMQLPDFLTPITQWMRKMEDNATAATEQLLATNGAIPFLVNIFTIGLMAGISEELLFRGTLTSIIGRKIKNPHVTIWIVAILFSAIHFQFFGFIPRMLLGAFLGYLLHWSKNIRIPIFIHFLNNTIAVVGYRMKWFDNTPDSSTLITNEMSMGDWWIMIGAAIAGLIAFAVCAKSLNRD